MSNSFVCDQESLIVILFLKLDKVKDSQTCTPKINQNLVPFVTKAGMIERLHEKRVALMLLTGTDEKCDATRSSPDFLESKFAFDKQ